MSYIAPTPDPHTCPQQPSYTATAQDPRIRHCSRPRSRRTCLKAAFMPDSTSFIHISTFLPLGSILERKGTVCEREQQRKSGSTSRHNYQRRRSPATNASVRYALRNISHP
jgi:hypothetical protein